MIRSVETARAISRCRIFALTLPPPEVKEQQQLSRRRQRVLLQERRRQQQINECRADMNNIELAAHGDSRFEQQMCAAYTALNDLCFGGRLPPAADTLHFTHSTKFTAWGRMFLEFITLVGIVLNDNIPTVQEYFNTLIHEMAHGDVHVQQLPIGNRLHGHEFKHCVAEALKIVSSNLNVFVSIFGRNLTVDFRTVSRTRPLKSVAHSN